MSEPLKPCPFCGGPAEEDYYDGPLAQCEKCNAGADREAWQRRAPDADRAALRDLVRELREALVKEHGNQGGRGCDICALLALADKALAGERSQEGKLDETEMARSNPFDGQSQTGQRPDSWPQEVKGEKHD